MTLDAAGKSTFSIRCSLTFPTMRKSAHCPESEVSQECGESSSQFRRVSSGQVHAVQYLVDGGEEDAASVLLSCDANVDIKEEDLLEDSFGHLYGAMLRLVLTGPRAAYDILTDEGHTVTQAVGQ